MSTVGEGLIDLLGVSMDGGLGVSVGYILLFFFFFLMSRPVYVYLGNDDLATRRWMRERGSDGVETLLRIILGYSGFFITICFFTFLLQQ